MKRKRREKERGILTYDTKAVTVVKKGTLTVYQGADISMTVVVELKLQLGSTVRLEC
jgi:hypothetical protein